MLLPETLRVHDRERYDFRYAYFLPHKGQVAEDLRALGAEVDLFAATTTPGILAQSLALQRYVRRHRIDIIHCHLPIAGVTGRIVSKLTGIPVVYTEHNKQERYHTLTRRLNLATMPWNQRVIACSNDVLASINQHVSLGRERVQSLQNGVNTARFALHDFPRTRVRAQLELPAEKIIVGTVCVFRTQKRLHHWLTLAERLYRSNPNLRFVLVGDGPQEEQIRAQVRQAGMEQVISFPGRISEVRPWLAAMDVYLMTSEFEGLPIAMLEAMSMELPVVATRAGGIGEAITDGENGFLAEVEDWQALQAPLERLIDDEALRRQIGQAARTQVQRNFSVQRMARELEGIYDQVILL